MGTRDAYIAHRWTEEVFKGGIVEMDPNDIRMAQQDGDTFVIDSYDLQGCKLDAPQHGVQILRMSDGTVKKVLVK